jgi:hypothetical protein
VATSAKQVAAVLLVVLSLAPLAAPARAAGQRVTLRGTYVQVHGDSRTGGETLHFLRTGTTWQRLRFAGRPHLHARSTIAVEGVRRGESVEVTDLQVLGAAPPAPAATGTRDLLVILVTWGAETLATTPAVAQEFVFGADARSTDSWYHDVSYDQLDWEGTVTPVLTVADPGGCDLGEIVTAADAAARGAGYTPADYDNQIIDFPGDYCDSRGFGEIAGTYAWIQDGLADLSDGYERLLPAHELGHNLGRYHSHGLECGGVTISAACLGSSSSNEEYGNAWDVMGNNWPGDLSGGVSMFGAKHLQELGWFAGRSQTVSASGTYRISPIELATAPHPQALEIATPAHRYYVEMRGPYGQDGFLSGYPQASNGVQVNLRNDLPGGDNGPLNLDLAPDSDTSCAYCDFFDSSLDVGQTYHDVDGAFALTVNSVAGDFTATVTVTFGQDVTPPEVVEVPTARFTSSIGTTRVPVAIGWAATDPSGVCRYDLQERVDGGPFTPVTLAGVAATSVVRSQADGHSYGYRVRATDCAGNAGGWALGPGHTLDARDQNEPGISWSGRWAPQRLTGAWRGSVRYSRTPRSSATYRFTGRRVAWVAAKGPGRGRARIYVDGVRATTVDLHASSVGLRRVVYQRAWASPGAHRLTVVVLGTAGRPRIDADAFVRLAG